VIEERRHYTKKGMASSWSRRWIRRARVDDRSRRKKGCEAWWMPRQVVVVE